MFILIIGVFYIYTLIGNNGAQQIETVDTTTVEAVADTEIIVESDIDKMEEIIPEESIIAVDTTVIEFQNSCFYGSISSMSGSVNSLVLKQYPALKDSLLELIPEKASIMGLILSSKDSRDLRNINYSVEYQGDINPLVSESDSLVLVYSDGDIFVKRTYIFYRDSYYFDHSVQTNIETDNFVYTADNGMSVTEENTKDDLSYFSLNAMSSENLIRVKHKQAKDSTLMSGSYQWMGLQSKYFFIGLEGDGDAHISFALDDSRIGGRFYFGNSNVRVYAGPIDYKVLSAYENGMDKMVNFGWSWISPISRIILLFISWLYEFIPNYGFVIIIFATLFILVFSPLTFKSYTSMRKMQMIQPQIKELQTKYKKDPEKLNAETMKLYKKHNVNPFTGCLPMFIQMPIFFALYQILRTTIELRGAPFIFWIADLSAKDPYFILPVVTGITMFFSQRISATDNQQKMLTYTLPIIMTVFFLNFPSGVVLYWLTYNVLSLGQQYIIKRNIHNEIGKKDVKANS